MKFKKGQIPWNKGLHIYLGGKRFEKGHKSWNEGIKPSYETIEKIRKSLLGKKTWNTGVKGEEYKKHFKNGMKGQFKKGCISWSKENKGKYKMPEEFCKKTSERMKGEKHHMWKGGISTKYRREHAPRPMPEECEICGKSGVMCYDHDHKTDEFRGWLCYQCNFMLGAGKDDINIFENAIKYLKDYESTRKKDKK